MNATDLVKRHEGLRLKPYLDTEGNLTIGYGRNLTDRGISPVEASALLDFDLRDADHDLRQIFGLPYLIEIGGCRYAALLSMMFNIGVVRFSGFSRMIAALKQFDWDLAASEMLDSQWARQVGTRATECAALIRTGKDTPL